MRDIGEIGRGAKDGKAGAKRQLVLYSNISLPRFAPPQATEHKLHMSKLLSHPFLPPSSTLYIIQDSTFLHPTLFAPPTSSPRTFRISLPPLVTSNLTPSSSQSSFSSYESSSSTTSGEGSGSFYPLPPSPPGSFRACNKTPQKPALHLLLSLSASSPTELKFESERGFKRYKLDGKDAVQFTGSIGIGDR